MLLHAALRTTHGCATTHAWHSMHRICKHHFCLKSCRFVAHTGSPSSSGLASMFIYEVTVTDACSVCHACGCRIPPLGHPQDNHVHTHCIASDVPSQMLSCCRTTFGAFICKVGHGDFWWRWKDSTVHTSEMILWSLWQPAHPDIECLMYSRGEAHAIKCKGRIYQVIDQLPGAAIVVHLQPSFILNSCSWHISDMRSPV